MKRWISHRHDQRFASLARIPVRTELNYKDPYHQLDCCPPHNQVLLCFFIYFFLLKSFEFEIPTEIRAACGAPTYLNDTYKLQAWVSPPVVDGGSAQHQQIIGDGWRFKKMTPFDAVSQNNRCKSQIWEGDSVCVWEGGGVNLNVQMSLVGKSVGMCVLEFCPRH